MAPLNAVIISLKTHADLHLLTVFRNSSTSSPQDRLTGLVVKASASKIDSHLRCGDFLRVESYQSLKKNGTPVATLRGAWYYRVSAGTGSPGVSILWLSEVEKLICNFSSGYPARCLVL